LIDLVAEESTDYADFVGRILGSIPRAQELAADAPTPVDPGFNEPSAANGADNYRHYASIMYGGVGAAVYQAAQDVGEVASEGEDKRPENEAEVYSDLASADAVLELVRCLNQNTPWYKWMGFDDDAWAKCRHLPGALWRRLFCKKWG